MRLAVHCRSSACIRQLCLAGEQAVRRLLSCAMVQGIAAARLTILLSLLAIASSLAAERKSLFNGKDLSGWQIVGDGIWTVKKDGTLVGQRNPPSDPSPHRWPIDQKPYQRWWNSQSWLSTKEEFH